MPASKKIASYPVEYFQLFEKAVKDRHLRWPRSSRKEAIATRSSLNNFRRALCANGEPKGEEFMVIKLTLDGNDVVLIHRDHTEEVESLRKLMESGVEAHEEGGASPAASDHPVAIETENVAEQSKGSMSYGYDKD